MRKLVVLAAVVVLGGCVSTVDYDAWQRGGYEASDREAGRFAELADRYETTIDFSEPGDARFLEGGPVVRDGIVRFGHDGTGEYAALAIDLAALEEAHGAPLTRLAVMVRPSDRGTGFVEVYPGASVAGGNPVSGTPALPNDAWSLVELEIVGSETRISTRGWRGSIPHPLRELLLRCFRGAAVRIDYILVD